MRSIYFIFIPLPRAFNLKTVDIEFAFIPISYSKKFFQSWYQHIMAVCKWVFPKYMESSPLENMLWFFANECSSSTWNPPPWKMGGQFYQVLEDLKFSPTSRGGWAKWEVSKFSDLFLWGGQQGGVPLPLAKILLIPPAPVKIPPSTLPHQRFNPF